MKTILVLGAGRSAPYLIQHLLGQAGERGWLVKVADRNPDLAAARVAGHLHGEAIRLDVTARGRLGELVAEANLVANMLPPELQAPVARACIEAGRHMVSVYYATPEIRDLDAEARARGVLLLAEIGLDPGLDHMAAMALVDRVRREGGIVESFESYGSGVPAPDSWSNPLRYAITWDPRAVSLAGSAGAQYLRDGRLKAVPYERLFANTWPVEVEGVGTMEAYPNRDSLAYRHTFGLAEATTLIRGTLRYPGWCETWHQVVRLGLPGEGITIPQLAERSFAELVDMFLPEGIEGRSVEERAARFLGLDPRGEVIENLRWLGLFSDEPLGVDGKSATDALAHLLHERLTLPPGGRDLVILHHVLIARYPTEPGEEPALRRERITATLVAWGEPGGATAMARTVGLPAALAAGLVLDGTLELTGCHIPTEPAIYEPVLAGLAREGLVFRERVERQERPGAAPVTREGAFT